MADFHDDPDLLDGIPAIAAFLSVPTRRAYTLHETAAIPTFKLGGKVAMRRSTWLAHVAKLESERAA